MAGWLANHYIELFGAVTGIIYVFLEIRQNIWLWPLGLITSAVYIWVFYNTRFYADMGLQWYYLFISIYGWYWWKKGGERSDAAASLQVRRTRWQLAVRLALITLALFALIWYLLEVYTDSPVPGWDAFTTAISIVATWMLAHKLIEHWLLWVVADVVSIGLYIYKGLYPTVVLFSVYTLMAVAGYIQWRRDMVADQCREGENVSVNT